jgi:selenide,water dikinase
VDDPYTFGQVAAANSLSDVYAMGGRPITALSIIGFPIREVPDSVMADILRGGIDKMNEAGVPVVGGHSIQDAEIKAGFAVTGLIDRGRIVTNAGARPGDRLVLTKPLGTGILAFAVQIGRAPPEAADAIARSMTELNKAASEAMLDLEAHACTDVTGFGLMGHLAEMARSSAVDVEIAWDSLPLFPHVLECLAEGIVPGGIERNRESSESSAVPAAGVTEAMMDVCFDPQTSGGLLVALAAGKAEALVRRLHEEGIRAAAVIGRVRGKGTGKVFVTASGARTIRTPEEEEAMNQRPSKKKKARSAGAEEPCCAEPAAETCCSEGHAGGASAVGAGAEEMFKAFMKTAGAPGALDAATKQALQIALSVLARCGPCIRIQVEKARKMGFTQAEIDEAVWMAIAFGGAPVMMFYKEVMKT